MFRQHPIKVESLVDLIVRRNRLETPLMQKRLLDSWDEVAGTFVARYTVGKVIRNQTLYISLNSPALRTDLSMRKSILIKELNERAGGQVIVDIKFN